MAMEYSTKLINDQNDMNNWNPFFFKNKNIAISHLLFADDVFLFCKANSKNIQAMYEVLNNFRIISGMEINKAKFKV